MLKTAVPIVIFVETMFFQDSLLEIESKRAAFIRNIFSFVKKYKFLQLINLMYPC